MNGKLQIETISSLVLKDNPLGDPRRRDLPVYLPPSYGAKPGRRYPVIYFLLGYSGAARAAVNYGPWKENIVERFDRLIAEGRAREALLVIVDNFTAYGGAQYMNSPATGRYEDFLVDEAVAFVEDKFAAVRAPEGRALCGHSSGGFGALNVGSRRPDVFGHVAAHSADAAFEFNFAFEFLKCVGAFVPYGGSPKRFAEAFRAARDKSPFPFEAVMVLAMASCFSPNPRNPLGFDLPFDARTGELIPAVWKRWQAHDPIRSLPSRAAALRRLKTLWFDAGTRDEFHLHLGARRLSAALKKAKVAHVYQEHALGHRDGAPRFDVSLGLLTRRLTRVGFAFLAAVLLGASARAQSPAPAAPSGLSGYVSAWRQECVDSCGVPTAEGGSESAKAALTAPTRPGQAQSAVVEEDFAIAADATAAAERVHAKLTFYYVCPRGSAADADCPSRYVQVQIELTGGARAFCAASLNSADAFPFPVLMCAGDDARRPGGRLGVSLSRQTLARALLP